MWTGWKWPRFPRITGADETLQEPVTNSHPATIPCRPTYLSPSALPHITAALHIHKPTKMYANMQTGTPKSLLVNANLTLKTHYLPSPLTCFVTVNVQRSVCVQTTWREGRHGEKNTATLYCALMYTSNCLGREATCTFQTLRMQTLPCMRLTSVFIWLLPAWQTVLT